MKRESVLDAVESSGLIAVIRGMQPDATSRVVRALVAGGVRALEVTMNSPQPLRMISAIRSSLEDRQIAVGAGTVLDSESARSAILAGADFVVAPNLNPGVIKICRRYSRPVLPGAMTPTEIVRAWEAGADMVKVFPAAALGPGFIRNMGGPLPQIKLVPTGGINLENAAEFIRAGAAALGVGGSLVNPEMDPDGISEQARALLTVIEEARRA
ncbi:MAG: bifunctional 4-hydroxy-2-oxoglutarate aldolase/2-dehydro-3-deoxy-phosphogluconate aldolase [Bacillota bacterium]